MALVVLSLAAAPGAWAQVNYAISGNTACVTRSPNASGSIVIASTYNGRPVTSIASEAFSRCTNLTSVTIPNSVTRVGTNLNSIPGAFSGCSRPDCLTRLLVRA